MKKNKEIINYCKAVKKNLYCSRPLKKQILHALECDISEFVQERPNVSAQDIISHFGNPTDFAEESLSILDGNEIQQKIKKAKHIKLFVLIAVIIICLIAALTSLLVVKVNTEDVMCYYSEEIINKEQSR